MDEYQDDLYWHALNYRTASTQHAEEMWQELVACVDRKVVTANEQLLAVVKQFDSLIAHQYSGSQEAMSALQDVAFAAKAAIDKVGVK